MLKLSIFLRLFYYEPHYFNEFFFNLSLQQICVLTFNINISILDQLYPADLYKLNNYF